MQKPDGIYTREMKHLKGCFEMADISGLCILLPRHYTPTDSDDHSRALRTFRAIKFKGN